ncbi:MAG: ABC transporter permease [Deltaproteobacteria bacterium]|nr:ABC transporter permease [Deltaproteobacteria bacterium]
MLLTLALRNLWRNRRRSLLTLSAMVVSSALLILALGVFSGMFADMLASGTEQYHGHMVISARGYQEDRDLFRTFAPSDINLQTLEARPEILAAAPRLRSFGLISHRTQSEPAELLGIDPGREARVTTLSQKLQKGEPLHAEDQTGALIGSGLARKLGIDIGGELVILTQAADGSIGNDLLTVRGIFASGDRHQDNALVLVQLGWLRQLLVLPNAQHEIALRLGEPLLAAPLADTLATSLPAGFEVLDWGDLLPQMRDAIAAYDVSRLIMVGVLYLATGLGILNTFFMSVLERIREFGLLMSLGVRPWQIRLLVLTEALLMGLFSLLIGVSSGLLLTWYMAQVGVDLSDYISPISYAGGTILPRLHAVFIFDNFFIPALLLLLISLLAAFLPANRAAKLHPATALREG